MPSPINTKKRNNARSMDIQRIEKAILENVAASPARLTPQYLEKTICATYGLDKIRAKAVLKNLIATGELEYTYEFGSTYLRPAFNKAVRISDHVVVKPPGYGFRPAPNDVVIQIQPGAAFGGGRHPTTRLSIRAIDYVLTTVRPHRLSQDCSVLDIGTGSGILAITAVCLGVNTGLGIDIDPCAISEAAENRDLNHLQDRLIISDRKIETIDAAFSMVIANLRYPSLKILYPQMIRLTDSNGWLIISGFRTHEMQDLMALYNRR
ncbi:MAG: 50S ribosomal protein L11 methyltransferase, partial [Deltaproteobacteria bacterium]|nr:50S ribosomal protein L11 methyltransferase [Deltaproteobacteria bacterium]